ncbi:Formylglycine-generating enzyme, required for sulfatase activity, contains SUMF1/FGE domain [Pedobacter westerhofensis]|uniref:Formylglycine-generating enzyme, required for sulfatase activity, contains SUMF1/FGE domain n=1 Tax=Pedobacter westerhofensis TaxID=425512 RepID=A0A521FG72_9SPHI|nr:SUMF1/EgtB/PvdO family nonheme iron enzyme [Pedobacter westerhofensis]SMO95198.1 Formylglycine-generating enzyme, required for sulfatase activity, contains SUMF1/FGE domain [Pedobacter westerhofensis]
MKALLTFVLLINSFFCIGQQKLESYRQQIEGTGLAFTMQPVPAGEFMMGSAHGKADELPLHPVKLDAFWMAAFELTWDLYEPFLYRDFEVSHSTGIVPPKVDAVTRPTKPYLDMTFGMGKENHPALAMTQYNAIQYCKWLYARTGVFYRLPTEAEWEYACRAGSSAEYAFGELKDIDQYAWYQLNSGGKTHEVGKKKPNRWGLYDLYGNVAEWTYDQYIPGFYSLPKASARNPVAVPDKLYAHVIRGGSYEDMAADLRSAARHASDPSWKQLDPQIPKSNWWFPEAPFVGMRLVRPLPTPSKSEIDAYYDQPVIPDY